MGISFKSTILAGEKRERWEGGWEGEKEREVEKGDVRDKKPDG